MKFLPHASCPRPLLARAKCQEPSLSPQPGLGRPLHRQPQGNPRSSCLQPVTSVAVLVSRPTSSQHSHRRFRNEVISLPVLHFGLETGQLHILGVAENNWQEEHGRLETVVGVPPCSGLPSLRGTFVVPPPWPLTRRCVSRASAIVVSVGGISHVARHAGRPVAIRKHFSTKRHPCALAWRKTASGVCSLSSSRCGDDVRLVFVQPATPEFSVSTAVASVDCLILIRPSSVWDLLTSRRFDEADIEIDYRERRIRAFQRHTLVRVFNSLLRTQCEHHC